MLDIYIFGFGLVVTLLVGSGLATMIVVHNRAVEAEEQAAKNSEAVPVRASKSEN